VADCREKGGAALPRLLLCDPGPDCGEGRFLSARVRPGAEFSRRTARRTCGDQRVRGFAPAGRLFRRYHERRGAAAGALQAGRPGAAGLRRSAPPGGPRPRPRRRSTRADTAARACRGGRGIRGGARSAASANSEAVGWAKARLRAVPTICAEIAVCQRWARRVYHRARVRATRWLHPTIPALL